MKPSRSNAGKRSFCGEPGQAAWQLSRRGVFPDEGRARLRGEAVAELLGVAQPEGDRIGLRNNDAASDFIADCHAFDVAFGSELNDVWIVAEQPCGDDLPIDYDPELVRTILVECR